MRLTDDRYALERSQFELALRMIRHEARTRTIRSCTGLSDDRIRKLYATYFRNAGGGGANPRARSIVSSGARNTSWKRPLWSCCSSPAGCCDSGATPR